MEPTKPTQTISQVFEEFLADQKDRVGHQTYLKYESIVGLYVSYLERYWPGHDDEYDTITKAGGTFCGAFGPEEITAGYGEFLGYFMPRKVMCGKETMRAAGTVTKKLAKWLVEKGYESDTDAAQERAGEAARDLPNAQKLFELLQEYLDWNGPDRRGEKIEDHFWIERVEPGKLWLKPQTAIASVLGPISLPKQITNLCQPMWDIAGTVVQVGKSWQLAEVWNVLP